MPASDVSSPGFIGEMACLSTNAGVSRQKLANGILGTDPEIRGGLSTRVGRHQDIAGNLSLVQSELLRDLAVNGDSERWRVRNLEHVRVYNSWYLLQIRDDL
jgi:hypothetical protein